MAFNGKVALIAGGGSGMGQLAARNLADRGTSVAILDVNQDGMAKTVEGRPGIVAYTIDITDTDAVKASVQAVEADLGPIDRVCNAAAIMPFGKLLEQDARVQLKLMDINYGGLVNIATAALPGMVQRGSGDFISFASMSGIIPGLMMGGYCSTKAAVATPLWRQAHDTVMPKLVADSPSLQSQDLLDDIEQCLEAGKYYSMPGKQTRIGYIMRRLLPDTVWKSVHKTEGF